MTAFLVVIAVLLVVAGLVSLGVALSRHRLASDRTNLAAQREVLQVEWGALHQARRVNDVFFTARDAMRRAESEEHRPY